jgi:hypothetical protein
MPTIATPNVLTDPGYLLWAPLGSAEPTNTVTGSVFTDTWPVAWIALGATEEGSTFSWSQTVEAVRVAELFDPVRYATTEQGGSIAFAMADWTLQNVKRAFNGGAVTLVSGTGATALSKYEPPEPSEIVRCMIGWESLDSTVRLVARQCINGGTIESAFRRAPDKALLPCEFQMERPAAAKSFTIYSAGATRAGT